VVPALPPRKARSLSSSMVLRPAQPRTCSFMSRSPMYISVTDTLCSSCFVPYGCIRSQLRGLLSEFATLDGLEML